MGVKGLNKYITENIRPSYKYWKLNKTLYKSFTCEDYQKFKLSENTKKNNDSITLIIDGYSYYYSLAYKLNWFIYDNLKLIELLQKQLHLFLSIENLEKIIFVFDGVDIPLKGETEFLRRNGKIESMKEFYNYIVNATELHEKNSPKTISPSPLSIMTFFQFLFDSKRIYSNIELKFSLLEADKYIAELANKYNGYVISNDSDFFIYKTPGYINLSSLEFPKKFIENSNDKYDFIIKYELYTNKQILSHFSLTYDTLPIFASLCGNDYLKIDNYPRLKQYFKYYKGNRRGTNSIQFFIYKNIVNFILDVKDRIKGMEKSTLTEYDDLTDLQKLIIEKMLIQKPSEQNQEIENDFKIVLIDSVRQYCLASDTNNSNEKICEDINKPNCWDITQDIREKMYELIFSRNNNQRETIPQIEELLRNGSTLVVKNVTINSSNNENIFSNSYESNFAEYLNIFKSNEPLVKNMPYYLIPVVSCLRFLLKEKLKMNSFVYKSNDKTYSHLKNNNINHKNNNSSVITKLYNYELEALIASSVAAMSFTFLNQFPSQNSKDNIPSSEFSIKNNINQNQNENGYYDNMYIQMKKNQTRKLQLKNDFSIKNLKK
ncbi:hypothetical protein PIROE2DRAFT_58076 [Piromyces sp. E2]|nr:hypothetical protein PIROE2DRAFT_58076 [Piromyces sp. E2]|eukprot:OUM68409.1 hypothetical protein PIROE2DRAFT_58076 [Piromyces sp. E2]